MRKRKRLVVGITMGDAAGIGPEVALKALNERGIQRLAQFLVIGNSTVLEKAAGISKIRLQNNIDLFDVGNISRLTFGGPRPRYGLLALDCIKAALNLLKAKKIDAMVTSPVNKYAINQAGFSFQGHTEYLASATKTKNFAMMLIGGPLKVVLATRHVALKDVAGSLTKKVIYRALRLTHQALKKDFAINKPRIGVCGLNPHSGERGLMGREEAGIIRPAIVKARSFANISGPLPADTLFYFALQGKFDAVLAMYHDQGLIPLKMLNLHQGVNLTLGLPFVRTSPDHGTAYDIAGKNRANPGSMKEAIKLAVKIACRKNEKK